MTMFAARHPELYKPRCVTCGETITAGVHVQWIGNGDMQHVTCPKNSMWHAKRVMGWWVGNSPVQIKDLVQACKTIIDHFEDPDNADANGEAPRG